ncbi:MAG: tetratricopeptide repeat protein [Rudaea sp.]
MAFDVLDDREQSELVQKWLRENVLSILVGIGLGLLLIFGWQQWRKHQASHLLDAATQFQVFQADLDKNDVDGAKKIAVKLQGDYGNTPYSTLSALRLAAHNAQRGDHTYAQAALKTAYESAGIEGLKTISGLYLARSEIAQNKPQAALTLLDTLPQKGYVAMRAEVRGDALAALGRKAEAHEAYAKAIAELDANQANSAASTFLEMKLNDLAGQEKKGS